MIQVFDNLMSNYKTAHGLEVKIKQVRFKLLTVGDYRS